MTNETRRGGSTLDRRHLLRAGLAAAFAAPLGALGAQAFARCDFRSLIQPLEIGAAWRVPQIFVNPHVAASVAENLESLARRAAFRVVINCCFHSDAIPKVKTTG